MTSRPPVIITTDSDSPDSFPITPHTAESSTFSSSSTTRPSPPRLNIPSSDDSHASSSNPLPPPHTPPRGGTLNPQDHTHLSPSGRSPNSHTPLIHGSPTPSWSSGLTPPSPTLTNSSSVHFEDQSPLTPVPSTSMALRGNNPTAQDGMDTLRVVGEQGGDGASSLGGSQGGHRRGWSVGTWSTAAGTEDTHKKSDLSRATSHRSWYSFKDRLGLGKHGDEDDEEMDEKTGGSKKKDQAALMNHLDPEKDTTDPTPFKEKPSTLAVLVDPKSLESLEKIGGSAGLLAGLGVDPTRGLQAGADEAQVGETRRVDEEAAIEAAPSANKSGPEWKANLEERRRVYGRNDLPERKSKSLLLLMWIAFKDKVLILLTVAAVVSLALGIYQDVGAPPEIQYSAECPQGCELPHVDWVEGVAICVAILIVVLVGSVNDWQKEKQFKKLNEKRDDRTVKCIRSGKEMIINVQDVVVGDICLLEPGEIVPVDGVFLRGHNVRCDESGATGESDAIKKFSYAECIAERDNLQPGQRAKKDCFLVSGAKVLEGVGEYVVIAVGKNSFNGRIMMSMRGDSEVTPLQSKLNNLAELIAKAGSGAGLLLFTALMIRFFVQLKTDPDRTPNDKAQGFIKILIISVTLIVVAVPEGLPLAVTLALAFATKRMTKQNLLVRVLGSCETMANATVVCTDKTGTLTQNVMSIVAGSLGVRGKFVRELSENASRSNANEVEGDKIRDDFSFDMAKMNEVASPQLLKLFNESICVNSTAFEDTAEDGTSEFVGSKTETALLRFAKDLEWEHYKQVRDSAQVVQMIPFSSELKAMGVVIKRSDGSGWRLYLKGASEILTKACAKHVVVSPSVKSDDVTTAPFEPSTLANIQKTIIFYANQSLRTIALCYRDFESWPPKEAEGSASDDVPYALIARDLTLIAITGIEDPLRPGVREAVEKCQKAGVAIKMCTGDNVLTARSIANQCGIFTSGGIIMEGPVFRKLSDHDRLEIVPRLQILARSSPEDKRLLVATLKSMGEVVGVTGDGTNDGPALKLANVGFAMGIAGTEVAKEASDIILMDDAFSNIVLAIMWGRCVNDSVKKFLQFQISVNITAVVITFVSAVASNSEESVLSAVQLLWVNLIMDTFAALALATDPARPVLLDRQPDKLHAPLITVEMIKMILVQALYQIVVCLVLHFLGLRILGLEDTPSNEGNLRTLVFNCFVFCQIFNQLNCRRLDRKFNVLEGFFRNYYFMGIFLIMVGGQILIVEVGGAAFSVTELYGRDWGISIIVGLLAIPLGALVRLMPTEPFGRFLVKYKMYPDPNKLPTSNVEEEEEKYDYNPALTKVKDNLNIYAGIRGGRVRASSIVGRSRHAQLRKADVRFPTLLTMVPTVIAGTVGAGGNWVSQNANSLGLHNPAQDPSQSSAELASGKIQVHPNTDPDDPLAIKYGAKLSPIGGNPAESTAETREASSSRRRQ
ncbi:hypothetical protein BD324DRAFT_627796 [Kockovaella imperatae]|uniref:Calcium-transporting ATPase n=1 Tax=Kockovaella imperatae TaxID=4999 RepID=A0A1Y1UFW7_9TREE|nr:hypothetical protein BD324DRAFT_627796 [Kockovaella imperatae]ORX36943.1 hypothetical protein BD324DRAFT_627796 [Kockovaella imperatae]